MVWNLTFAEIPVEDNISKGSGKAPPLHLFTSWEDQGLEGFHGKLKAPHGRRRFCDHEGLSGAGEIYNAHM